MAFDLKTATPDTSFPSGGFLFGADSQSATDPSIYTGKTVVSAAVNDLEQTWNDALTVFTGLKLNVTDTASDVDSKLLDLQSGGVSRAHFLKQGRLVINANLASPLNQFHNILSVSDGGTANGTAAGMNINGIGQVQIFGQRARFKTPSVEVGDGIQNAVGIHGLLLAGTSKLWFQASGSLNANSCRLEQNVGNQIDQHGGVNAQAFNIFNTRTDASNYERVKLGWASNAFEIKPEAAGTGTVRVLHISGLPTSNPGPGILWNDAGTVKVGT